MGRKNQIQPFTSIGSADVSGDMSLASITGSETVVSQTDVVQYQVEWTGAQATNGTIAIEASIDGLSWFELDFGSLIPLNGASGDHQIIIQQVSFVKVRPVYTRTNVSATGTLTVKLFATTVGA